MPAISWCHSEPADKSDKSIGAAGMFEQAAA